MCQMELTQERRRYESIVLLQAHPVRNSLEIRPKGGKDLRLSCLAAVVVMPRSIHEAQAIEVRAYTAADKTRMAFIKAMRLRHRSLVSDFTNFPTCISSDHGMDYQSTLKSTRL